MTQPQDVADRHASWLELFFDLVVVVAVSQLAHLVHGDAHHGPGGLEITTFFALYLAIWLVWTTFTLYSNVVAERIRQRAMFLGMAGIALMAAAVPDGMGERSAVFAAAYLTTSALGAGSFTRSGQVLLSWSAATRNSGLVPWVIAFWVHDPWWKLGLWLLGLGMTVWFSILGGRADGEQVIAALNERLARRTQRVRSRRGESSAPTLVIAQVDAGHLGERLGLFVIIVLGEAMLQLVGAFAEVEDWSPGGGRGWLPLLTVAAGFCLLIVLWWLNVRFGFAEETRFSPSVVLPAHFVAIAAITTVAAGLGTAVAASTDHLPAATAWLTCSGATAYLLVVTCLNHRARRWPLSAAAIALPLVAALLSPLLPAVVVVVTLLAACAGQAWNLRDTSGPKVAGSPA
jgi:low temperature requirement protein LtrA